jgi:light-regulated signal transduction histidine kinase (bacteriophytochrome)
VIAAVRDTTERRRMQELRHEMAERQRVEDETRRLNDRLEQRVAERTAQLEAANRELESFAYSVSHDLRAPLRQIDGFAQLLREVAAPVLPARATHYLARIEGGTRHMGRLVDDLLALARVGRQDLRPRLVPLNQLVADVLAELHSDLADRDVEWRIGPLPTVVCDPGLMRVVFNNLLSNALKYTRRRQRANIEVGQANHHGLLLLHVRDNGVGFDMAYADKLFGVFQRLHRAEDFEGTGVGLATVQRIVAKHGGRIWAEASVDHGATFYFTIGPLTVSGAQDP